MSDQTLHRLSSVRSPQNIWGDGGRGNMSAEHEESARFRDNMTPSAWFRLVSLRRRQTRSRRQATTRDAVSASNYEESVALQPHLFACSFLTVTPATRSQRIIGSSTHFTGEIARGGYGKHACVVLHSIVPYREENLSHLQQGLPPKLPESPFW